MPRSRWPGTEPLSWKFNTVDVVCKTEGWRTCPQVISNSSLLSSGFSTRKNKPFLEGCRFFSYSRCISARPENNPCPWCTWSVMGSKAGRTNSALPTPAIPDRRRVPVRGNPPRLLHSVNAAVPLNGTPRTQETLFRPFYSLSAPSRTSEHFQGQVRHLAAAAAASAGLSRRRSGEPGGGAPGVLIPTAGRRGWRGHRDDERPFYWAEPSRARAATAPSGRALFTGRRPAPAPPRPAWRSRRPGLLAAPPPESRDLPGSRPHRSGAQIPPPRESWWARRLSSQP